MRNRVTICEGFKVRQGYWNFSLHLCEIEMSHAIWTSCCVIQFPFCWVMTCYSTTSRESCFKLTFSSSYLILTGMFFFTHSWCWLIMYVAVNNYYLVFLHSCIRLIYLSTLWKYYLCYRLWNVYGYFSIKQGICDSRTIRNKNSNISDQWHVFYSRSYHISFFNFCVNRRKRKDKINVCKHASVKCRVHK